MHAAVAENANDTNSSIAVAFVPDPGECIAEAPIAVFGSNGSMYDTDLSKAEPRGYTPGVNEGLEVNDLWWGSDGHFHATIASWTCDNSKRAENDKQILASPSGSWRLDGRAWVKEGTGPATMMRQFGSNIRVVLTIPGCIGPKVHSNPIIYCNTGRLFLYQGRKQTIIARKVISISAPSPEGVPHTLPAAIPALGQLAGDFSHGQGFGKIRPSEIYNGGDPTGLVTHVTWKSWAGPHAVGTGISEHIGPNQTANSGSLEHATIVAFNLGTCDGERMYQAVEWYFPKYGQTFNPHQYENICTGTYVPNP